ncbi:OprO/OprP family phosphate-selective porin [Aureliella helgolandensis]|uniref:Porin P n=1 Tax=Aureliella helgolandensis TaxID=2527968 RepID=A0A518GEI3_9BACT|nr:porin [Aureliella helgolandensis]QDV27009.1 Porin P precursor [Aureliella helgolandensis]
MKRITRIALFLGALVAVGAGWECRSGYAQQAFSMGPEGANAAGFDSAERAGPAVDGMRMAALPWETEPGGLAEKVPASEVDALAKMQADLDKRLADLEEQYKDRLDGEKQAKADAQKKPTFDVGGRIHMDYWGFLNNDPGIGYLEHSDPTSAAYGTDPEDRFQFRRIRLEFDGAIPQNMEWKIQLDFNNPGTPEYKDAYFGWNHLPGNQTLLLGNQKRPLGLDHLNSSRYNVFAERPLVVESFNEDARRVGACFYGVTEDESVNWRYGIFNLENTSTDGRFIGDSLQMGGYGRLAATPWYDQASGGRGYYHCALAGAISNPDGNAGDAATNANEGRFRTRPEARSDSRWLDTGRIAGADWYEIIALESVLNLGRFQLTGEYMTNFMQRDNVTPGTGDDLFFHGFYVYASYFLTGEHLPISRSSGTLGRVKPHENFFLVDRLSGGTGSGWGAWQLAARYDYLDLSDADIRGGVGQSCTMGLNWHWNAYSKVQTNLICGDIRDHKLVGGFDGGDYWILGTRFMCDF